MDPTFAGRPDALDLTDEVTLFVTTVGAPTFEACLARLGVQDTRARLVVIRDVAPASAAFQRMLDECRTPYYVQVDEDMLLVPSAVRQLHDAMAASGAEVFMVVGWLWDPHLEAPIHGVKLFRHAIAARYPWTRYPIVIERQRRIVHDGFTVEEIPEVLPLEGVASGPERALGLHRNVWTPQTVFERYATLERMRRANPFELSWFERYPRSFLGRFRATQTPDDAFALLGLISGALAGPLPDGAQRDHRDLAATPGLDAAQEFWAAFGSARPDGAASAEAGR